MLEIAACSIGEYLPSVELEHGALMCHPSLLLLEWCLGRELR